MDTRKGPQLGDGVGGGGRQGGAAYKRLYVSNLEM